MAASDRSAEVAEYFTSAPGRPTPAMLKAEVTRRWPDLSREELYRAADISVELLRAEAVEHFAEAAIVAASSGGAR